MLEAEERGRTSDYSETPRMADLDGCSVVISLATEPPL